MGAVFTVTVAVLVVGLGQDAAGQALLGALLVFAALESVFGICVGCIAFGGLMRAGLIPPEICERCGDLRLRPDTP